jgi:WD40 repeat protein
MAVSPRWGGGGGGGPWQNELTTEADLLTFGWNEIGSLEYHDKESLSSLNWSVHERVFSAGESYRIRNEKYLCPVYFFPPDKGAISNDDSVVMLKGHTAGVQSVAFSPDGKWIVSGGVDKTLKVWDAETGEEMLTLQGHSEIVRSVNFSPDGRRIVSGGADKTIKVWDTETGQEMLTLRRHSDRVFSVAFSPDGKRIVSGSSDKTVKVWELGLVASGQ